MNRYKWCLRRRCELTPHFVYGLQAQQKSSDIRVLLLVGSYICLKSLFPLYSSTARLKSFDNAFTRPLRQGRHFSRLGTSECMPDPVFELTLPSQSFVSSFSSELHRSYMFGILSTVNSVPIDTYDTYTTYQVIPRPSAEVSIFKCILAAVPPCSIA